jgi:hypothetical protein
MPLTWNNGIEKFNITKQTERTENIQNKSENCDKAIKIFRDTKLQREKEWRNKEIMIENKK